ncbi:type II 3-dehydroquinate dehydratase [Malaciobacter marinus]|jgi:3-dehydroquinate dehydratase-2|uniref:3-dehydroquinate dehydratase n=1 Tax=Malaciobacter marinus TaxID=505249 RepID=A0A1T5A4L1_9BACT|nr:MULTISPECIES: type II 3-dehydroquinate dehydratase [Malaciobacter]AXX86388.1 3-dehydroquinate dehydratase [Malaciobacter marinus]PHO11851.1 type II 3-dehydroquinate dehydratase [Malaciobacter marinus]PHO16363.1 type II 3-dehydroquinate dehydratase [Malaciobacter marinus]PPK62259.1 3-dehydroquinate dehydratase [Malaciobacter marinus]RYA22816.1 type II 3-dehydroquinate dehydratase [Malaciobacter halophilus]
MKIAVIQGPNLNMLGVREQHIYGPMTLEQIHEQMKSSAQQNNVELEFFQSNLEGEIVDKIQECLGEVDGIIINPAAYSHTSIAIKDALSAVSLPVVEVHISNIYKREEFRQKSITAGASTGVISGFGPFGYHLALISLMQIVSEVKAVQEANDAKEQ